MTSSYPSRRSTRLRDYDYAQPGAYFVTVCLEQRLPLLGRVIDGEVFLSAAGIMVATVWGDLERHYGVGVDAFVVMPNHVHGILVVGDSAREDADGADVPTPSISPMGKGVPHDVGTSSLALSAVIARFKTFTMHEYGKGVAEAGWPRYSGRLWQHRFYEHVIRNERDLQAIRQYIANNPGEWEHNGENPDSVAWLPRHVVKSRLREMFAGVEGSMAEELLSERRAEARHDVPDS